MDAGRCPDKETLYGYMMGTISQDEAETVDQHLASCSECERTAEALERLSDTMLTALRQPAEGDVHAEAPECGQVLQRLRMLQLGNPRVGSRPPMLPAKKEPRRITRLGDYDLLKKLGQGGMGTVYKAQHTRLKRIVAVKVLPKNRLEDKLALARFAREMEAVGRLDHPNIVRAMDAREVDRIRFLVMEYVDGLDLSQVVARCGALSIADAAETIRQAALGLECSRENGLVHRDVKPSNLMLTTQGQVKVLDLGLAQIQEAESLGEEVTGVGQVMGTPDYISPEQALESHTVDIRTDVYSLGCTLYCLLAGHPPFVGADYDTPMKKVTAQIRDSVPSIQVLKPGIPKPITRLLERMLAKDPKQRVGSPSEVAGVLAPFCKGSKLIGLLRRARSLGEDDEAANSRIETGELQASAMLDTSRDDLEPGETEGDLPAAAALDPYHRWLGIPPAAQPANHYGLLGLAVFEDDREVIRDAAARQMAHVRTYQLGQHVELSQKILNELGAAKACLLDGRKKAAYDARLRAEDPSEGVEERKPPEPPPVSAEMLASVEKSAPRIKIERSRMDAFRSNPRGFNVPRFKSLRLSVRKAQVFGWIAAGAASLFVLCAVAINITTGTVQITIRPGDPDVKVEVRIDGREREMADLHGPIRLGLREHRLVVSAAGYEPHEQTFRIERGDNGKLTVTLVPLETEYFTNSRVGMKFARIPAGEFMMGSPEDSPDKSDDETPRHPVRITEPFYLGVYEVTQEQYEKLMEWNPSRFEGATLPVERVSWESAKEFCRKLSEADSRYRYRLPSEAEWEYACRAGEATRYGCGDDLDLQYAWFDDNSGGETHPAGRKRPNAWGLYDMHGNVSEWCEDYYVGDYYARSASEDPGGPASGSNRVHRGGSWDTVAWYCRSAYRYYNMPGRCDYHLGFRVAAVPLDTAPPPPERLPQATQLGQGVTNRLGMKFRLIPAGEFMMGSLETDPDKEDDEIPRHRVWITRAFYLGVHEVTQQQYEQLMGENPSHFKGPTLPVKQVSWQDATAFCEKLSEDDEDFECRLPTEAEWEYACRAGTTTRYSCGDDLDPQYGWFSGNGERTQPVGQARPNGWGLYDMHGNVCEWCQDWYAGGYYTHSRLNDPKGPAAGALRVYRGGCWNYTAKRCRSAIRYGFTPDYRNSFIGFRVVLVAADSAESADSPVSLPKPSLKLPEPSESSTDSDSAIESKPIPTNLETRLVDIMTGIDELQPAPEPDEVREYSTNDLGMKFTLIPAGEFMMGSSKDDPDMESGETPQHLVRITKPFYLGAHEVTQGQYAKVTGEGPSRSRGPTLPVERVSWEEATAFCAELSARVADFEYRLPTEAEWEYACRAGTTTRYSCGDELDARFAWFGDASQQTTHPVGEKRANPWGLYDMHGNVWEWCRDFHGSNYYATSPSDDPAGPSTGFSRVLRGGSWVYASGSCRSALRFMGTPDLRGNNLGFRVVQVPAE